jgi:hypothetical protein
MVTPRKRVSAVWEFFDEPIVVEVKDGKPVKKIPCKLCDQQLADGGGTTNLSNHLQSKHPEEHKRIATSNTTTTKQDTLTRMFPKCSVQRASTITDLIAEFVAKDMRPLNVADVVTRVG